MIVNGGTGLIVIERAGGVVSVSANASVTCGVKGNVFATVGVPEITPVEVSRVRPVGSVPVKLQTKGAVPPVRWRVWL